jgi:phenylalanyl-tRNA synthetase alpha chain
VIGLIELREQEKKTLQVLWKLEGKGTVEEIIKASSLAHAAVMRAALKLSKENLVQLHEQKMEIVSLNREGQAYAKKGLPERRLVNSLNRLGGKAKIDEVVREAKLQKALLPIALGWLRRKKWASFPEQGILMSLNKAKQGDDERIINLIARKDSIATMDLEDKEQLTVETLRKRKLVNVKEKVVRTLELTPEGRKHVEKGVRIVRDVSQLTPELIITGKWRKTKLRKFNVSAAVSKSYPGKLHPLQQIVERARRIFLQMGFTEIRGPLVETAFWNFDALFQPQDHPAREMQDTFYLSKPKAGRLPEKIVVDAVARVHEDGWTTDSKGWGYEWSRQEARRLVLRTHTTAETIKYLSKHKKPPIKVFSVDKVYRNERLTYKNTAEFYQIEGIIVDEGVTLRDLMGTLKAFYSHFGLDRVQFWPCYFPYTEPSAQAMVYVPKLKHWMELCGMGIFRPEVVSPMGIEYPVLAWGGGLERIAMVEFGLDDIRKLYGNDLGWIRSQPLCL